MKPMLLHKKNALLLLQAFWMSMVLPSVCLKKSPHLNRHHGLGHGPTQVHYLDLGVLLATSHIPVISASILVYPFRPLFCVLCLCSDPDSPPTHPDSAPHIPTPMRIFNLHFEPSANLTS